MDYKNIVEKAIKGEDYTADIKDFTDDQKKELSLEIVKGAKIASDAELVKVVALRKEGERIAPKAPAVEDAGFNKFKDEQEAQAKKEFFSNPDYPLTDAEKVTFENTYKKLYSGEVSKEGVTSVLKMAYGAVKPDELVSARKKVAEGEEGARRYNAGAAGASGSGPTEAEMDKYSAATKQLYSDWQKAGYTGPNYTIERAKKISEGGLTRKL